MHEQTAGHSMELAWVELGNGTTVIVNLLNELVSMTNYGVLAPTEQGLLVQQIQINIPSTPCMELFTIHCTGVAVRLGTNNLLQTVKLVIRKNSSKAKS